VRQERGQRSDQCGVDDLPRLIAMLFSVLSTMDAHSDG
jgi:hypothetical protein